MKPSVNKTNADELIETPPPLGAGVRSSTESVPIQSAARLQPPPAKAGSASGVAAVHRDVELGQLRTELEALKGELKTARQELEHRRQEEVALSTAEARLRLVMEAANIGCWDWDIRTNTVYHSPEWKRQLGYDDHEVTNEIGEWQHRLHPDDQARVRTVVHAFMCKPKSTYDMEFRLRHRDGSYRWIHSQGRLILEAGKPVRLLGVHVDITGSKERESALQKSEQRYRRLVEMTHIIPWEADPHTWQYTYVGPRSPMIVGYSINDWLAEGFWLARLHPEDRATAAEFRRDQTCRVQDFESEYRMIAADGHVVWFHDVVHVLYNNEGIEKLQGFLVDVSERKRAAEEHGRLAAIVESSNDAIIGETLEGVITSWNKSAERIYGYTASEAVGRSITMLIPKDRSHELAEIIERMRQGELVDHMETVRVRKDGRQIHVSLVVSPIRETQGKIVGASAIAREITERKQLEAEVLRISEREQQRIAQDLHDGLGQLLSGTVHLANVLQLELAEQALPEAAEALRITELLNEAVSETRSLARGLYPVRPESNGLEAALQELAERTRELFKVKCSFRCPKPVPVADNNTATHVYRIAQEAVTNALKHGRAAHVVLLLTASQQRLVLRVRDDGCGFGPATQHRKGMGVRIMQYRAEIIGGRLSIQREEKRGVVVLCTVPREKRPLTATAT